MVSTHTDPLHLTPALMSALQPHVIVLFAGAGAGDLARATPCAGIDVVNIDLLRFGDIQRRRLT